MASSAYVIAQELADHLDDLRDTAEGVEVAEGYRTNISDITDVVGPNEWQEFEVTADGSVYRVMVTLVRKA